MPPKPRGPPCVPSADAPRPYPAPHSISADGRTPARFSASRSFEIIRICCAHAFESRPRPVTAAFSITSNGKTRSTLDVNGTTVTTPDARFPASLLTMTTGRRLRISPPIVGSSTANQISPRRIVFDPVGAGRFEIPELLFLAGDRSHPSPNPPRIRSSTSGRPTCPPFSSTSSPSIDGSSASRRHTCALSAKELATTSSAHAPSARIA